MQLLEQAVARDPAFLLAHYQLAFTNDLIYFANYDHTETRLALVQTSIDALVRLQPDAGETHTGEGRSLLLGLFELSSGARGAG